MIEQAWRGGFSTKSDFARKDAIHVGVAASLGLISTRLGPDTFGTTWHATPRGLRALWRERKIA